MRVTFEPTNFTFTFHDNYFVQLVDVNGVDQPFVASFLNLHDAIEFGRTRLESAHVKGFLVFSRTAQYHTEWKRESVCA